MWEGWAVVMVMVCQVCRRIRVRSLVQQQGRSRRRFVRMGGAFAVVAAVAVVVLEDVAAVVRAAVQLSRW